MLVSNVIKQAGDSEDIYKMAIRYYFSHLRAWLVESPNLKKNRTVQNYLLLYERQDLLTEVNQVLELHVTEDWTLRYLIMTTGLAGGLLRPYKGLLPALESKDSSKQIRQSQHHLPTKPIGAYFTCYVLPAHP